MTAPQQRPGPQPKQEGVPRRGPAPLASVAAAVAGAALIVGAGTGLGQHTQWRMPLLGAVGVLGLLALAVTAWRQARTRIVLDLEDGLAPLMKPDSLRGFVRVSRRHWGKPSRIRIRYPADFPDSDEKQRQAAREVITTRLGSPVTAVWKRSRRTLVCIIDFRTEHGALVESDSPPEVVEGTPQQREMRARASEVVQAVMGASAEVRMEFEEGSSDPASISVVYGTTAKDLAAPFRQRVLMQVSQKLPGDWRDVWEFEENRVRFERRLPFPSNVPYPVELTPKYGELPYAAAEDGSIRYWTLGSKSPHHLVVGPTGSGKTVLIRALVLGAIMQGIPVVLMDPKRTEYLDFQDTPGVTLVTSTEDIADAIQVSADLMDARYAEIEAGVRPVGNHGKILVIMDEFAVFKARVNKLWEQQKKDQGVRGGKDHPCLSRWSDIILMGRTAEVHGLLGLQRPDADVVQGILRDSFRKRTALDQHTRETAMMMWGNVRVGTRLPSVQGRAMSETGDGAEEVQVLRVIPPTAGGDAEDTRIWKIAHDRAADPALWAQVRLPEALQTLTRRRRRAMSALRAAHGTPAPVQLEKQPEEQQPAPVSGTAEDGDGEETPEDENGGLEEAGAYDLAEEDVVLIEDETGIPVRATVLDLAYTEDDEGGEWVEVTVLTEDGTEEVREISAEETLTRQTHRP